MIKILVLEDNLLNQDFLQALLSMQGYEVVCAMDGQSGLARVTEYQPDLVISDINMPEMDGLEVLRQLRLNATTATLPVIICTSADESYYRRIATKLKAGYLTKPFEPTQLLALITEQLESRSPHPSATIPTLSSSSVPSSMPL